jgi:hypothetical protein
MKVRAVTGARTITANSSGTFKTVTGALAANDYRKSFTLINMAVGKLLVNLSGTAPTATACHFVLPGCTSAADGTGGSLSVDGYVGAVTVAGTGAGGSYSVVEFG